MIPSRKSGMCSTYAMIWSPSSSLELGFRPVPFAIEQDLFFAEPINHASTCCGCYFSGSSWLPDWRSGNPGVDR
eukprot:4051297-Pleurochrysis_carterae.AAC.2